MFRYLLNRLFQSVLVIFGVSLVVFALTYASGDPVAALLPLDTPREDVERFRQAYGFDQPLPIQYVRFIARAVRGNFGQSLRYRESALSLVLARLPLTITLAVLGLFTAVFIALPLGSVAALWRGSYAEGFARLLMVCGQAAPNFWLALVLILVFAVTLRWLPSSGFDDWRSLVLPTLTIAVLPAMTLARLLRANLLDVLKQDYIRTAHAKGLPRRGVWLRHALRNAAIPLVTLSALQLGTLLGGALITEAVFALPGMGRLTLQAITARDVPLIQAFVIVSATCVAAINLVLDMVYVWLNPQIQLR
jgi:peptide/nickel transport system permease protein